VGNINEVMQIILKEFEYQSSLELESDTYDAISHIPLANKIGVHARQASTVYCPHIGHISLFSQTFSSSHTQELISRLEHYQMQEPKTLYKAIQWIDGTVVPQVTRHAISGAAMIRTCVFPFMPPI
jgi:adenylate kinase